MINLTSRWPLGLNRRNWFGFAAGFVALLAVFALVDAPISQAAIHWPDAWRAPFFYITDYGLSDWVLIPSLAILLVFGFAALVLRRLLRLAAFEVALYAAFIFVGVGLPGLVSNLIKRLVGRGRPVLYDEVGAFNFQHIFNDWTHQSFPSGHTTTALAVAFVFGFLQPRLFPPLLVIGLIVGFSRIAVGMHYPTDVLGGVALGMLGAYGVRNVFASRRWLFRFDADGRVVRKGPVALRRIYQRARR